MDPKGTGEEVFEEWLRENGRGEVVCPIEKGTGVECCEAWLTEKGRGDAECPIEKGTGVECCEEWFPAYWDRGDPRWDVDNCFE